MTFKRHAARKITEAVLMRSNIFSHQSQWHDLAGDLPRVRNLCKRIKGRIHALLRFEALGIVLFIGSAIARILQ